MSTTIWDDQAHQQFVFAHVKADPKPNKRFYFGHEIETDTCWNTVLRKADQIEPSADNRCTKHAYDFMAETGWMPSYDGSIRGVEYKSPLLRPEHGIHERVARHIDHSRKAESCGGHIHIYHPTLSNNKIADIVRNHSWLVALLYYKRHDNNYCELSSQYHTKYNWLYEHSQGTAEIRLFDAPKTAATCIFRMNLLLSFLEGPTADVDHPLEAIKNYFNDTNLQLIRSRVAFETAISIRKRLSGNSFHKDLAHITPTWNEEARASIRDHWNHLIDTYPEERRHEHPATKKHTKPEELELILRPPPKPEPDPNAPKPAKKPRRAR